MHNTIRSWWVTSIYLLVSWRRGNCHLPTKKKVWRNLIFHFYPSHARIFISLIFPSLIYSTSFLCTYEKKVINYDSRGGISIETRKGEITTSHLLIQNADETNSGKYSCSPSNAIVASIRVHVLNGKWLSITVIYSTYTHSHSRSFFWRIIFGKSAVIIGHEQIAHLNE